MSSDNMKKSIDEAAELLEESLKEGSLVHAVFIREL